MGESEQKQDCRLSVLTRSVHNSLHGGTTILVVTHGVHGARKVGDLFAVFDKGDLIAFGTATEVEQSEHETARLLITED